MVSQLKYADSQYGIASPGALQHASMVAHNFLQRAGESPVLPTEELSANSEDIYSRADSIVKCGRRSDTTVELHIYCMKSRLLNWVGLTLSAELSIFTCQRKTMLTQRIGALSC